MAVPLPMVTDIFHHLHVDHYADLPARASRRMGRWGGAGAWTIRPHAEGRIKS
jgi:hypothetical protein